LDRPSTHLLGRGRSEEIIIVGLQLGLTVFSYKILRDCDNVELQLLIGVYLVARRGGERRLIDIKDTHNPPDVNASHQFISVLWELFDTFSNESSILPIIDTT